MKQISGLIATLLFAGASAQTANGGTIDQYDVGSEVDYQYLSFLDAIEENEGAIKISLSRMLNDRFAGVGSTGSTGTQSGVKSEYDSCVSACISANTGDQYTTDICVASCALLDSGVTNDGTQQTNSDYTHVDPAIGQVDYCIAGVCHNADGTTSTDSTHVDPAIGQVGYIAPHCTEGVCYNADGTTDYGSTFTNVNWDGTTDNSNDGAGTVQAYVCDAGTMSCQMQTSNYETGITCDDTNACYNDQGHWAGSLVFDAGVTHTANSGVSTHTNADGTTNHGGVFAQQRASHRRGANKAGKKRGSNYAQLI